MRIVFMGTPAFAVPSLDALIQSKHTVIGIVTQPDRPKGRGQALVPPPIKQVAEQHGLACIQPEKMKAPEVEETLRAWQPDVIAVAAFGRILRKNILTLPPLGCVNVHASLLPKFRGAAPIQWAVMQGEQETGVTTMLMDEGMDTGAILLQKRIPIDPQETPLELSPRLAQLGAALLVETLDRLEQGTLTPQPQDHDKATMAPLLTKEDGLIVWSWPAETIVNRILGLIPWPGSYTYLEGERLMVWRAQVEQGSSSSGDPSAPVPGTVLSADKTTIRVVAGRGIVAITEVQPPNRKRMTAEQFLAGHPIRAGIVLTSPTPPSDE